MENVRKTLELYIIENIKNYIPHYVQLKNIKWIDTISKPIRLDGDYNVSNTLTDIL